MSHDIVRLDTSTTVNDTVRLEIPRRLRFEIFRFNPEDSESEPHLQTFELDEQPFMTLYLALNQIREKIGVMFGSPETTTGGRALKFYSSVRIDIRRIGQI